MVIVCIYTVWYKFGNLDYVMHVYAKVYVYVYPNQS